MMYFLFLTITIGPRAQINKETMLITPGMVENKTYNHSSAEYIDLANYLRFLANTASTANTTNTANITNTANTDNTAYKLQDPRHYDF